MEPRPADTKKVLNAQKEMEDCLTSFNGRIPRLLLHACCAPCSSAVLERLTPYADITVFFYNPNITEPDEYRLRRDELRQFIDRFPHEHELRFLEGDQETDRWLSMVRGHENDPERGGRCRLCFTMRLFEAARIAKSGGYELFATTLTLSPLKNAAVINVIGDEIAREKGIPYLVSDFKKKDGYKRSIELSNEYGLYRQDYCGCIYSRMERDRRINSGHC